MFTIELRVNGALLSCIYGHNDTYITGFDKCRYTYRYIEVATGQPKEGTVVHDREDGLTVLAHKILSKVVKEGKNGG